MFDPDLLRTFVAVSDCASFTRAAQQLHLTQSTISYQMKRLERQAGQALLQRTTRRLALTPEGEVLLGYARNILLLQEAARRQLNSQDALRA